MREKVNENRVRHWFDSVADLSTVAKSKAQEYEDAGHVLTRSWYAVDSWPEAWDLARDGWEHELDRVLELSERAVDTVERTTERENFHSVWDVTGAEVDVAKYLTGEPECMIDYPSEPVPKMGRVITLCASVAASCDVSTEQYVFRGVIVTALALQLSRMGLGIELWADMSSGIYTAKTLVKGANDVVDPAKIMFAYGSPAMLRALHLPAMHAAPKTMHDKMGIGFGYGHPKPAERNLPEGTIYLPELSSERHDINDAAGVMEGYLREIGLLESESV